MTVVRSLVLSILSGGNGEMTRHFYCLKTRLLVRDHRGRCDRSISCLAETRCCVVEAAFSLCLRLFARSKSSTLLRVTKVL